MKNIHIHIIGIGGISLSAIAKILIKYGYSISGSDVAKSDLTSELEGMGVKITYEHNARNVHGANLVIFSAAIHCDNPEIIEAKKLKIKIISRAEALGNIAMHHRNVIAIAGSHGKTTTTGMISACFIQAGKNPTIHIGGVLKEINSNVRVGGNEYFITEACEYMDSFLKIKSNTAVALNVQPDHMDYFKTFTNLQKSFQKFLKNTKKFGVNIVNNDDAVLSKFNYKNNVITYGINNTADLQAKNLRKNKLAKYSFDLYLKDKKIDRIKLSISGEHQVYNALACISVCLQYKIDLRDIKIALANFTGIKRRWEEVGYINNCIVIHDYAHHPTEIEANIKTASAYVKGRVIVVFQPHTYSRTKELFEEFKMALMNANIVLLYKIYPARELPIQGITSKALSEAIKYDGVDSKDFDDFDNLFFELLKIAKKDDIVLILGAGDIDKICCKFKYK